MVGESIRGLVLVGVCAAAALAGESVGTQGATGARTRATSAAPSFVEMPPPRRLGVQRPRIQGGVDARRAWLGAEHRGLVVQKFANTADGSLSLELQFRRDHVSVGVSRTGAVAVARGGRRIDISSVEAFEQLQGLLAGSEVAFAVRVLLAEREATSDLDPPEMSLLSAAAFVASLLGDVDAPRRLSTRFVQKHRGIYRPVRLETCFEQYATESSAAWNDMQNCMDEANQDSSVFARAYRRVACNAVWLIRAESAWAEYLGCLGPGQFING
jgi:hypothetical protein